MNNNSKLNEYFRFLASGMLGTCIFYGMYEVMFATFPSFLPYHFLPFLESIAWTLSYILSIIFQHYFHAKLVFRNWDKSIAPFLSSRYLKSLVGTYFAYALSLFISPIIAQILATLNVEYRLAFVCNLGITGLLNYLTVRQVIQ